MTKRHPLHEWTDPITHEKHTCPVHYLEKLKSALSAHLGESNAILADALLLSIAEPLTEASRRHLRQAVQILRGEGHAIVSKRSSKGGYFHAATREEVMDFVETQERLAKSMLAGAEYMRRAYVEL